VQPLGVSQPSVERSVKRARETESASGCRASRNSHAQPRDGTGICMLYIVKRRINRL